MKVFIVKGRTVLISGVILSLMLAISVAGLWSAPELTSSTELDASTEVDTNKPVIAAPASLPIYSVETPEKLLSIGINCAWDNADIPQMLAILESQGVKATFFLLGQWAEKYPETAKSIADAGHEIASHSYTHRDLTTLSPSEISEEITKSMESITNATRKNPRLVRTPSGAYNSTVIDIIRDLGYEAIQWDVDTLDWKGLTAQEMLLRVTAKSDKGSILLIHSGAAHSAEALSLITKSLQDDGYRFTPIGELIHPAPYTIDHTGRLQ